MNNKIKYINSCFGLTIVEVLVVLFIVGILLSMVISTLTKFRENNLVNVSAEDIFSILNEAKSNTLIAKDGYQYGVHIEATKASLFKGNIFNQSGVVDEAVLHSTILISQISLNGGGSDVIFDKLTGKTNQFGGFVIESKTNPSVFRRINIEKTGTVTLTK